MRDVFAILFSLLLLGCNAASVGDRRHDLFSPQPFPSEAIDSIVENAVNDGFSGQLVVLRDGVIVYQRAAGSADLAGKIPVVDQTLYQASSITKFFTAILAMKAVEEGKLSLGDSAATLFPGTALAARDFTLAEMLDHRSGLRSTYAAEKETDPAKAVEALAEANRNNLKDGEFHYSNDAFDALAIALERIYEEPFEEIFQTKIAAPAGISNFAFWGATDVDDPHIRGQPLTPTPPHLKGRNYGMIGSAGLLISATDLALFRRALDAGKIVNAAMLSELNAPREQISIGRALYGAFLLDSPLGPAISARGAEDWGDNGYLNYYPGCSLIVALLTSRGPADDSGQPLFRDSIVSAIEEAMTSHCGSRA